MKKLISMTLVALFIVVALFANGATEKKNANGITTLTWALWDKDSIANYQPLIDAFEAKNPDIKIEMLDLGSADYSMMLQTQLSGGDDSIDIVTIKDIPGYNNHVKANLLENLNPYIKKSGVDTSAYNGIADQLSVNGNLYAIPYSCSFWVIFYNKDLFDAAGVEYPTNDMTFEEYDALARKMTSGSGADKVYGSHYHIWRSTVQLFGILDGKHKITDGGDYSYLKPYYEMVLSQQDDGVCMNYGMLKTSSTHYSGVFYNNSVATMNIGTWFISTLIKQIESGNTEVKNWGIVKYPHAEGVEPGSTLETIASLGISKASKNKDAAWKFVEFATGEEGAMVVAKTGIFPAMSNDAIRKIISSTEGFPTDQNSVDALETANVYLEMPLHDKAGEIEVVLNQAHDEIMTESISIDEGLKKMGAEVDKILAK